MSFVFTGMKELGMFNWMTYAYNEPIDLLSLFLRSLNVEYLERRFKLNIKRKKKRKEDVIKGLKLKFTI